MQELEKILEEMKKIKDGNRKENLYAKYPPKDEQGKILNGYSQGYEDGTDNFYNVMVDIIHKHMGNDGWIPVEERLPEVPDDMEDEYCPEFNVTIKGASRATTLKYSPDGAWFDDSGQVYVVIAWRPLPDLYRSEKGAEIETKQDGTRKED
ncbi:hypothetical protein [Sellimonas intestinalis]|uniref:hypothetical protein n=1 Tax=Sellimonas intestinalis TaxID=1653434 RepID=UPI0006B1FF2F|nr:hypothetical protein [Sellimonas intestinalis]